jgi:glutathione synthase
MENKFEKIWSSIVGDSPAVAVAIHDGHDLRPEVREIMRLSSDERLREEDPYTGRWVDIAATRFTVHTSRFEMDLNRPRDKAVYLSPDAAWGLDVWQETPSPELVERSLKQYDSFYEELYNTLGAIQRMWGQFIVLDLHSYNHRRDGRDAEPAAPEENPVINIGTGSLDRDLWAPVINAFTASLAEAAVDGERIDVRENVRFKGGFLSQWVHETFPGVGCAIAIEVKKVFMDEWTGEPDEGRIEELKAALASAVEPAIAALKQVRKKVKRSKRKPRQTSRRPIKIGFVVNDIMTEQAGYTSTRLAMAARHMGHEVWLMGVGELNYDSDEHIRAHARGASRRMYKNGVSFLKDLQGKTAIQERITLDELDVVLLRNDPALDAVSRPWASQAGILFGRLAMRTGTVVLNDPDGLAKATSKMYFQAFPADVRPETIITRNRDDVKAFAKERGTIVLKPLTGSGGQSVFLVRPEDVANINQMFDSVSRDGYVIAQEYLPAAEEGDMRLFVMNGESLVYKGKYAAFRRVRTGGDLRSNIHAGGSMARAEVGPAALELVEIVRPKLMQDGMFLAGLDIVGDKIMEINVFSPGGLGSAQKLEGVNFCQAVIKSLERKADAMKYYRRQFDNVGMAIM